MNGILQNYFFKNQIIQKSCTPGKNLSFTGDAVNIVQEIPEISDNTETYALADFYSPDCYMIDQETTASIVKNNNTVEFRFRPSKCHNKKEQYQMFSAGLYTAIKRAQETGAKEVIFKPSSPNINNFAFDAGFKKSQSNTKKLSISEERFEEIIGNDKIGNDKIIGTLEKIMLKNVNKMKEVDKVSDKFKINGVLPDNKFLEKLFPSGIKYLYFIQNLNMGDCYFLSALNSVSKNPNGAELIAKMIEPTPDKKYKVTFPGYPKESFIVNPATDIHNSSSVRGDLGVKILEHTFYRLKERLQWPGDIPKPNNKKEWLYGGKLPVALFILTGGSTDFIQTPFKKDESNPESFADGNINEVIDFLVNIRENEDRIMVCASTCSDFEDTKINEMGIYPEHCYSISNINPKNKTLSMINPHYSPSEETISYDDFFKYFCELDYVELKD